jgi:hypothetical protein
VTRLSAPGAGPLDLDAAARGGPDAAAMLSVVAARCTASATAMIVTANAPLGLRGELRLTGLSQAELAEAIRIPDKETAHALWVASRGLPGVALPLARELSETEDPVVYLALRATSAAAFLDLDTSLIRLLEMAAERARDDATRSRILARLARELLGDASAGARRRSLADEALRLARRADDPGPLAVALDARLYALWDPDGAADRLAAGAEIIALARAAGDDQRERQGQFWRFVPLMELGRVTEAESALAAYAREAAAAGDAEAARPSRSCSARPCGSPGTCTRRPRPGSWRRSAAPPRPPPSWTGCSPARWPPQARGGWARCPTWRAASTSWPAP